MKSNLEHPVIAEAIRLAGGRATPARTRILSLIKALAVPLSHAEIEYLLDKEHQNVDRVTIYRVLDWLAEAGLAHKAADAVGVFRFSAADPEGEHAKHVHLRCTGCGGLFCLDTPPPPLPVLPSGFRLDGMALDIRGECPRCTHSRS
jgi:Fur family ferric uptake transcriptional regulator